jgi:hypothetical protein
MRIRFGTATMVTVPALAGGGWWQDLHHPAGYAGLCALLLLVLAAWPLFLLAVVFGPPALVRGCVPRDWRRRYRGRHGRQGARSSYIPRWLRRRVLAADRHRCVARRLHRPDQAGLPLHVDHFMPWRLGGLTSLFNLFVLCEDCNLAKSVYWRYRSGNVVLGHCDPYLAPQIAACERRARRNPLRWIRAAWAV